MKDILMPIVMAACMVAFMLYFTYFCPLST